MPDLDKLRGYDADSLLFEDLTADYQFRLTILRTAVAQYQYDLTMGIDYHSHVKEEMNRRAPFAVARTAYYSVWTALSKIQPKPPLMGKIHESRLTGSGRPTPKSL